MQKYFIFDETMGNNFLLCEQCIQAERSEYTRFSMLEKEMRVLMDEHFLFRYMDSGVVSRYVLTNIKSPAGFIRQRILCEKSLF